MNNNPKISLTMNLEGSVNKIVGYKTFKGVLTALDLFPSRFPTDKDKKSKAAKRIIRSFKYKQAITENVPAKKHLALTKDAYDYMTSPEMPAWFNPNVRQRIQEWMNLSSEKRLALHMACIAQENHAIDFTYSILDD